MFPYGHVECSFDSIAEQGLTGGQKFSTQYHEVVVFSEKLRSKGSFGHVECSSENPRNNNLVGGHKIHPKTEKDEFFSRKRSAKCSYGHVIISFCIFAIKLLPEGRKFLVPCPKRMKKHNLFDWKKLPNYFPMDTWIAVFTTPWKCFSEKFFQSVSLTDKERKKNSKKSIKIFQRTRRRWLWQPHPKKLQHKAKTFSLDL